MRLHELGAQLVCETKELRGVFTPVRSVGAGTVCVVRAEVVVNETEAGLTDETDRIRLRGGISGEI